MNGNWAYAYDYFNRLKTAAKSGLGLSYTYDRYGNRWKQTVTPPGTDSPSFSFTGGNNRIDQLCHDAAGNVLDDRTFTPGPCPTDLNSVRFKFDAENRLTSVDGGATGSYVYDAEGRRVRRVEQGTVRNYVYDLAGRAITEIGGNGSWVRGEIYAGGRHLGTYVDGKTYFAHSDWLGTERLRSRLIGTEKERFTSWPFGDHLESSGGNSSTLHFTGKERDAESGLDYFGARYFSSNLGRWMSPDWSDAPVPLPFVDLDNPQSLNLYGYAIENPISSIDIDGHSQRSAAVRKAWVEEQKLVRETGEGTRLWTSQEKAELLKTGKVQGYQGHHINSVKGSPPKLIRSPNNVEFASRQEHFAKHGNNWRNPTSGPLLNRGLVILQVLQMVTGILADVAQEIRTGIQSGPPWDPDRMTIVDPSKAAVTLNGQVIAVSDGNGGAEYYRVQDGQFLKENCAVDCSVDPNTLKDRSFQVVDPKSRV